ncbi:hypothetical protein JTB14_006778 [Gonioctena quinquepunctata]|nr:hypothetical protein JTB14_006778 [Gonioctena quinquepunctata]
MNSSGMELPDSILEAANSASFDLLPGESEQEYEKQYKQFKYCFRNKETNIIKEEVFLAHFTDLRKTFQPNTSCNLCISNSRTHYLLEIHSDNGTNFVGGEREMKKSLEELDQDKINAKLSENRIKWILNPSVAPHMSGVG